MHVAGISLEPHAGDADLRLRHVFFSESGSVEHRLRCALRFRLRDLRAVFVELGHVWKFSVNDGEGVGIVGPALLSFETPPGEQELLVK